MKNKDKKHKSKTIESYLNDSMTLEEKEEFEKKVQSDERLQLDVQIYMDIKDAFADKELFKSWLVVNEVIEEHKKKDSNPS